MAVNTAEKTQPRADTPADAKSKGQVAVLAAPRLPYNPVFEELYGVDKAGWKALVESVFPGARTADAVFLALSYCKARKLDIFKRVVHIVPIWDREKKREVETVWPGIAEHRTTAFRTKQYAGADPANFGPMIEHTFTGAIKEDDDSKRRNIVVRFPEWCQITVYRTHDGTRVPHPGPRVYWMEYYSRRGRTALPNDRWERAPIQMLEKCAEAAALRRAFPEELGDEPTEAEAGYYGRGEDGGAGDSAPKRPTRKEFVDAEVVPEFTIVGADGEVRAFADANDACEALAKLLDSASSIGAETIDGVWESNQQLLDKLNRAQCEAMEIAKEQATARAKAKSPEKKTEATKEPPSPLQDRKAPWPPRVEWIKSKLRELSPGERSEFLSTDPDVAFIEENRRGDWQAIELLMEDLRNEGR